jgi:PIN domain nuclease of toxin-antitoxin system
LVDCAASRGSPVYLSAVTLVEVAYLVERRRIPADSFDMLLAELQRDNPAFVAIPLDTQIAQTLRRIPCTLVPDMPDRIIAATAVHLGLPLVTRDRRLQASGIETVW